MERGGRPDVALARPLTCPVLISGGTPEERRRIVGQLHQRSAVATFDCRDMDSRSLAEALAQGRPATVLLENVDHLTSPQQQHLASWMEHGRKGSSVRPLATTQVSLFQMVTAGRFLAELFYRLNVIHVILP